ncbi:MAG TPA: cupin domain-containing protein [Stellaceae bacterium]|jgi:uncharacterized cupin superfamily protein|nr:cupin domain-containing protein [Stellaceae bacterium]
MTRPVFNIADLTEFREVGHNGQAIGVTRPDQRYEARLGAISTKIGAQKLGYNLTIVPPGKRAFPRHSHRVNEEMFFILEGEGELIVGAERHPVKRGDVIACPPGGPETAHQIRNTSASAELKYLAISTRLSPEVVDYPDSNKTGIYAEFIGADGKPQLTRFLTRTGATLDYWEGE